MNIKEISGLTGKTQQTIRNWVKAAQQKKLVGEQKNLVRGKHVEYSLKDTIAIIRAGGNETLANLLNDNAKTETKQVVNPESDPILKMLEISSSIRKVQINQESRLVAIESKLDNKQNLLEAPRISDRSMISKTVRGYADRKGLDFASVWNLLYGNLLYSLGVNVKTCAKNRDMQKLDYLEAEGHLPKVLAVALELFGE